MFRVKARKTKFVLISIKCSGTTLVSEYLNSHPDIFMAKELFKVSGDGRNIDAGEYRNSNLTISKFLDEFYARGSEGNKACGFKLTLDQIERFREIQEYLIQNKIACIYMERSNILKTYVSRMSSRTSNIYHTDSDINIAPVILDADIVKKDLDDISCQITMAKTLVKQLKNLTIIYEDLIKNTSIELRRIQKYLNVKRHNDLTIELKKINVDELNYAIANYSEIYTELSSVVDYSKYLESVRQFKHPYTIWNEQYKCIFIHVPKVAGSSIEKALYGTKGLIGHHYATTYREADRDIYHEYYKFCFVRNPYDRAVSAYLYLINGGRNKYDRDWRDKNLFQYKSFKDFIMALGDKSVCQSILSWIHFEPQYKYICDENKNVIVDYVGRFESLEEDFQKIIIRMGINVSLPHKNAIERKHYENYYDDESRSVVHEVYREDFEIFEYSK